MLGCGRLRSGTLFALTGCRIGGTRNGRRDLCIDTHYLRSRLEGRQGRGLLSEGCGTARGSTGVALQGRSMDRGMPSRASGAARANAATVTIEFRRRGGTRPERVRAAVVHLPAHLLRRLGRKGAFSYWVAEVPLSAEVTALKARDRDGRLIASNQP